jgi:hypothetical protein
MTTLVAKPVLHGRDHCHGGPDPIPCLPPSPGAGGVVYADYVASLGPIGYWRLGETGEPWVDSTADDNDMELQDHGVALTPNVAGALPDSQDDGAVQFNFAGTGGSTAADYLTTGIPSPSNSLFVLDTMTVAAFVKVSAYPGASSRGMVAGSQLVPSGYSGWAIHVNGADGKLLFTRGNVSGGPEKYAASPGAAVLGDWYHVAGTYDNANLKLYLNGALVTTTADASGLAVGQTDGLHVGSLATVANSLWFTGSLDELAVWNYALTADQIATLNSATSSAGGTEGYVLTSDGTGGLSWAAPTIEVEF